MDLPDRPIHPFTPISRNGRIREAGPMVLGPIYAIRGWGYVVVEGIPRALRSLGAPYTWTNPPEPAICAAAGLTWRPYVHPAPELKCTCGYYSHKPGFEDELASYTTGCFIFGVVELAGRVIEHTTGYRSELAYPRLLVPLDYDSPPLSGYEDITQRRIDDNPIAQCRKWITDHQEKTHEHRPS